MDATDGNHRDHHAPGAERVAGAPTDGIRVRNGMRASDLGTEGWHRPWSGGNGGNCVEVRKLPDGRVALRQSDDPHGPALIYTSSEIAAFIRGAKAGQADFLLS